MKAWLEDLPLDFTRDETRAAERLLITGYPLNVAALTLAQDAGLDLALLNQMSPVKYLMREILVKARGSDRLITLIAEVLRDPSQEAIHEELRSLVAGFEGAIADAAMRRRPSISTLAMLPPSVEAWGAGDVSAEPLATPGLEKTINKAAGFADPAVFRQRLAEAEVRTARIDIGGKAKGTGFLVADGLLITNWHVVSGGAAGGAARFDHRVAFGEGAAAGEGRVVPFATEWLVAHSPHEPRSVELRADGPPDGNWDFAVVRLADPVGSQTIGPDPAAEGGELRGRYALDGSPYDFEEAEPILIVGHPEVGRSNSPGQAPRRSGPPRISTACGIRRTRRADLPDRPCSIAIGGWSRFITPGSDVDSRGVRPLERRVQPGHSHVRHRRRAEEAAGRSRRAVRARAGVTAWRSSSPRAAGDQRRGGQLRAAGGSLGPSGRSRPSRLPRGGDLRGGTSGLQRPPDPDLLGHGLRRRAGAAVDQVPRPRPRRRRGCRHVRSRHVGRGRLRA